LPKCHIEPDRLPKHIAIIMDGNGRWATERGLPRTIGHKRGYGAVRRIVRAAGEIGISYMTLYTFSTENWKRIEEASVIMELIRHAARRELSDLQKNNIKLLISGRIDDLPAPTRNQLLANREATKNNTGLVLNLAVNYGGRLEIVDAVRQIARKAADGSISPDEIIEETISGHLYTPEIPDPDLLIRTAGEMRISNFLLWEIAYAEIWVTPVLWPDFTRQHLLEAIADYQRRRRKFGGIGDMTKAGI